MPEEYKTNTAAALKSRRMCVICGVERIVSGTFAVAVRGRGRREGGGRGGGVGGRGRGGAGGRWRSSMSRLSASTKR